MAWSGFGWLGYVVIFGTLLGTRELCNEAFGPGFSREHAVVVIACAVIVSSLLCWPIGRFFNRHLPWKVFDADWAWGGRTVAHSTFFVRLECAGLVVGLPIHVMIGLFSWDH